MSPAEVLQAAQDLELEPTEHRTGVVSMICPLCGDRAAHALEVKEGIAKCRNGCDTGPVLESLEKAVKQVGNGVSKGKSKPPAQKRTERTGHSGELGRRITLRRASTVEPEVVRWAWEDRIPEGALSLLAGQAGLGKSTLTAYVAAKLSRGELDGSLYGEPCDILLVTLEDHIGAVVRPRLEAAGADLTRVHFLGVQDQGQEELLTFPDDLPMIEKAVEHLQPRLLIVDPIVATLSKATDAHKDQSVRRALAPLAAYAERAGVAVCAVMHLTKQEADSLLHRVSGSVGFGGAARAVLGFLRDPDDADGEVGYDRLLLPVKCNWGRYPKTLRCQIKSASIQTKDGPSSQSLLEIVGESDITQRTYRGSRRRGRPRTLRSF